MQLRTDLAIEAAAQLGEKICRCETADKAGGDIRLTSMVIEDEQGRRLWEAARQVYCRRAAAAFGRRKSMEEKSVALGDELRLLLPQNGMILVVGLGNQSVTPTRSGPRAAAGAGHPPYSGGIQQKRRA